jgi:copper chaperone CopZ
MEREVETASLLIAGLVDAQRRNSVRSALEAIRGVASVEVHPQKPQATVVFDPTRVVPRQLRVAVRAVGCSVEAIWLPSETGEWASAGMAEPLNGRHAFMSSERQQRDDADLGTYLG